MLDTWNNNNNKNKGKIVRTIPKHQLILKKKTTLNRQVETQNIQRKQANENEKSKKSPKQQNDLKKSTGCSTKFLTIFPTKIRFLYIPVQIYTIFEQRQQKTFRSVHLLSNLLVPFVQLFTFEKHLKLANCCRTFVANILAQCTAPVRLQALQHFYKST